MRGKINYWKLCGAFECLEKRECEELHTSRYPSVTQLIAKKLKDAVVVDFTYGRGRMWKKLRPKRLIGVDINGEVPHEVEPDVFIESDLCSVNVDKLLGEVKGDVAFVFDPPFPGWRRGRETFRKEFHLVGDIYNYVEQLVRCFLSHVKNHNPKYVFTHLPVPIAFERYECKCHYVPKKLMPFVKFKKMKKEELSEPISFWMFCEKL